MAIHMRTNNHQSTLAYIHSVYQRYYEASKLLEEMEEISERVKADCNEEHLELFTICQNYW